ncbi:MAG: C10 family peptidase [Paludibacteraceae bacterium]|nr:C10 family peptidase [Paludibacteraceae bacterium]
MRRTSFFLFLCCLSLTVHAATRSIDDASALAADLLSRVRTNARNAKHASSAQPVRHACTYTASQSGQPAFYVFNGTNGGFAVVSADDRARDVLCYSDRGSFDASSVNPSFRWLLDSYAAQIAQLDNLSSTRTRTGDVTPIAPLLGEIAWDQNAPYYNACPMDDRDNTRCLTGCVATATAMIMRYWQHPAVGQGSHSYIWYDCMNSRCSDWNTYRLGMDFSTVTFDWANMLPVYSKGAYSKAQADAVANLMYAVAIAGSIQFGGTATDGSSGWTDDMGYGLTNFLDYTYDKCISTYPDQDEYEDAKGVAIAVPMEFNVSAQAFENEVNASLEAGFPVLIGGEDYSSAHEFVLDGRDAQGRFHVNWGWNGDSNNYCYLSALKPDGKHYSFSLAMDAIVGLRPNTHTALPSVSTATKTTKYIRNRRLYILHGDHCFDAQGQKIF